MFRNYLINLSTPKCLRSIPLHLGINRKLGTPPHIFIDYHWLFSGFEPKIVDRVNREYRQRVLCEVLEVVYKRFLKGLGVGVCEQLELKKRYLVLP